jgi:hypothetical protein
MRPVSLAAPSLLALCLSAGLALCLSAGLAAAQPVPSRPPLAAAGFPLAAAAAPQAARSANDNALAPLREKLVGPRLVFEATGGLVPPEARYPNSFARTTMLNYGGNITLANPNAWGWNNTGTQLCMMQGFRADRPIPLCPPSGGLNWNGVKDFAGYASIDNVQMGMVNTALPPELKLAGRFGPRDFTPDAKLNPAQLARLHVDMQLETDGDDPWRSIITGWSPDGTRIDVAGWYRRRDEAANQVPTAEILYVNPADRIWNVNNVLALPAGGFAKNGTSIEIDVNNAKAPPDKDLDIMGVFVNSAAAPNKPDYKDIGAAFVAQGGMRDGFVARGGHDAFFLALPDTRTGDYDTGFLTTQTHGDAFAAGNGRTGTTFSVSAEDGSLLLGAHGRPGSPAQSPSIAFYSQGRAASPSATIRASDQGLTLQTTGAPITIAAPIVESAPAIPASSHAACTPGQHAWDANYDYRCVAPNTWKRAALSAW